MSDHDESDDLFRDFRAFIGDLRAPPDIDDSAFKDIPQMEGDHVPEPDDELILGVEDVTYLLHEKGRELVDFLVSAGDDQLEIKSPSFTIRRLLGVSIDPTFQRAEYRNGTFSLRLKRNERSKP